MQAGKLRDRITIERMVVTRDELGGDVRCWVWVADVWCQVAHLSARELTKVRAFSSQITTKFTIRWMPGVDNTMRIRLGDVVYSIAEILQPDDRRRAIEMLGYAEVTETTDV